MGLTPVGCFGAVPDAEISISTFRYLSTPALDSQRGVFANGPVLGSPYPERDPTLPSSMRPLGRYGRHYIFYFFEEARALDRAFRTLLHPPSTKTEVDLGEDLLEDRCGGGNCGRFQLTTSTTESRLRRTLKLPYRSVLQFVAPDFQSDMPKVRNAVEGRQDPVGTQPFDEIPPPRRRGMEWGMRCVGSDSRVSRPEAGLKLRNISV
ncbi:hypothetical protein J6590_091176 [Homalodisca vitripennis]|nr:hypothetical protein J6590_091176 [Homalodisca vitripennis]